ncbi:MAG: GxxExxY protein [Micropepsaceae bacterium]
MISAGNEIPQRDEEIAAQVVDAAYRVHAELGPGLLESAYEHCLAFELTSRGLRVGRQVPMPIVYRGETLGAGYRLDLLVETRIIVEVKAAADLAPIHQAQLLTYLRLSGCRIGFLINFNERSFKSGLRRFVL